MCQRTVLADMPRALAAAASLPTQIPRRLGVVAAASPRGRSGSCRCSSWAAAGSLGSPGSSGSSLVSSRAVEGPEGGSSAASRSPAAGSMTGSSIGGGAGGVAGGGAAATGRRARGPSNLRRPRSLRPRARRPPASPGRARGRDALSARRLPRCSNGPPRPRSQLTLVRPPLPTCRSLEGCHAVTNSSLTTANTREYSTRAPVRRCAGSTHGYIARKALAL